MISEVDRAYAAGLLDGEGYVGSIRCRNRESWRFRPRVQIAMIDLPVIEWLQRTWGGTIYIRQRKDGGRTIYCWHAASVTMERFVRDVRPYMRVKGDQADTLLELHATMGQGKAGRAGTPEHVQAARLALHDRLKALKAA